MCHCPLGTGRRPGFTGWKDGWAQSNSIEGSQGSLAPQDSLATVPLFSPVSFPPRMWADAAGKAKRREDSGASQDTSGLSEGAANVCHIPKHPNFSFF